MKIEHKASEPTFSWWVVREDGAIVCACVSEDAAERVIAVIESDGRS